MMLSNFRISPFLGMIISYIVYFPFLEIFSLLPVASSIPVTNPDKNTNLILVQTLFRHGDRSPVFTFPTDPNKIDFWPEGEGQLSRIGKKQHYAVGKFLRSMYQDFITSDPTEINVTSSDADRCLTSAESQLASFYAPEGRWKFDDDLNWQPIPIHYLPGEKDKILSYRGKCPRVEAEQKRKLDEILLNQKYQAKFEDWSNYTGLNISDGFNELLLFDTFLIEKKYNLTIVNWADSDWHDLEEVADADLRAFTSSPLILRLRAGPLLQDIRENMKKKINGDTPKLKVRVYSSHDLNLATVFMALNFTNMPRPPYAATLLFELHKMPDNSSAVRLLYLNSTDPIANVGPPHVLILDDCSEFCPVENFFKKFQHHIPENWEEECQVDKSDTG